MEVTSGWTINDHTLELEHELLNEAVPRALNSIGITMEKHAKENCPVDTGLLHNSITFAISGESPNISTYSDNANKRSGSYGGTVGDSDEHAVYVGTNVEYAAENEFFERSHKVGRPHFLRDAAATHNDEYKKLVEAAIRSVG